MDLLSLLSWAIVELQSPNPNLDLVRSTLDKAFAKASEMHIEHNQRTQNLIRIAQAMAA